MIARLDARAKLFCLIVYVVAALHARTPLAVGACVIAAIVVACAVRLGFRDAWRSLRPLLPIVAITVVMQVLTEQQGDALVWLGGFAVTREALLASCRMVLILAAIMVASVSFMRCTTAEELMVTMRWLLRPLHAIGLRTDAFMLSLSVAFRFIPVLVNEFGQLKRAQQARLASFEGGVRTRLDAYLRLFAPLVRSSFRRADTLGEAFLARCFSCGREATTIHVGHFGAREGAAIVVIIAFVVAVFAL